MNTREGRHGIERGELAGGKIEGDRGGERPLRVLEDER